MQSKLIRLAIATAVLLAAVLVSTAIAGGKRPAPGSVQVLRLPAGGGLRTVRVYRPPGADSSRLPVLYFLHGLPGSSRQVVSPAMIARLERGFAAGHRRFVLVAPDGQGNAHEDSEWADSVDGSEQVESWLTRVVIPAVEGSHRRTPARRAIAGFSMGGYGAMNIAMRHRELFGTVVALAGYFHVDDPSGMFGGDPAARAANSPDVNIGRAHGLHILLRDGRDDRQRVVAGESQRFAALLARAGIPARLEITAGGHDWAFVAASAPAVERFLDSAWG